MRVSRISPQPKKPDQHRACAVPSPAFAHLPLSSRLQRHAGRPGRQTRPEADPANDALSQSDGITPSSPIPGCYQPDAVACRRIRIGLDLLLAELKRLRKAHFLYFAAANPSLLAQLVHLRLRVFAAWVSPFEIHIVSSLSTSNPIFHLSCLSGHTCGRQVSSDPFDDNVAKLYKFAARFQIRKSLSRVDPQLRLCDRIFQRAFSSLHARSSWFATTKTLLTISDYDHG